MTHPKGLRLANETYAREGYPDRLYIPLDALSQWHRKWPCLPAFEPVCVGDPCVTYVRQDVMQPISEGREMQALMDEVVALKSENERLRYVLLGVGRAIDTGRNEPIMVWRDQINIALDDGKGGAA